MSSPGWRLGPSGPQWWSGGLGFLHHQRSAPRSRVPDPAAFPTVFSSVESRKRAFLTLAQLGISFFPLVIEAVGGGWLDSLRLVVAWVASESNRCSPLMPVSRSRSAFHNIPGFTAVLLVCVCHPSLRTIDFLSFLRFSLSLLAVPGLLVGGCFRVCDILATCFEQLWATSSFPVFLVNFLSLAGRFLTLSSAFQKSWMPKRKEKARFILQKDKEWRNEFQNTCTLMSNHDFDVKKFHRLSPSPVMASFLETPR